MEIHCETSVNSSVVDDPYKNLLRTQTEAMSAITGGADSLTVVPFDTPLKQRGEFSERIARNQQLILREEAYFKRVSDPSAGSYYIEKLTALVAEKAWDLFLETEKNGGFLTALDSGLINTGLNDQISEEEKSMTT
jgi:methylmalonyl-CoA mutase